MRALIFISMMAVVTMVGLPANAQETRDDPRRDEATRLFQEGYRLSNKNMLAEALEKYEKSYAVYPSPNALLNIARNEQLLGRRLKAIRHFREAIRSPLLPSGGVEYGKKYIAELEPSFAQLDLTGPTGLVVSLGNEEVKLPLPEPLDIEPAQQVAATGVLYGQRYEGSGKAVAGRVVTIEMRRPGERVELPRKAEKSYWTGEHITGVTLGGLAIVAAGVGIGFALAHGGRISDGQSVASDPYACRDLTSAGCQSYHRAVDSAKSTKTGEIVSFVAAGALAVGAVVLLVPWQTRKEGSQVTARVIPTGQGILLDGAF